MSNISIIEPITNSETLHSAEFVVSVEKQLLLKALSHVQSIVEKRNIIPILSNVKLVAGMDTLELTATDMDISVSEKIKAKVTTEGSLTIPAHTFYDIVRKLPDSTSIILSTSEIKGKMDIKAGSCHFTISYLNADEFPILEQGDLEHKFEIPAQSLRSLITKTKFAISTEETRYNLNGIYLHVEEKEGISSLIAVATDGHRLSLAKIAAPKGSEGIPGIIIPKKAIFELSKIIEAVDSNIEISLSSHKIHFIFNQTSFITKLIDASFPEYSALIPEDVPYRMEVNTDILSQSVDRVSTITFDKSKTIKFTVKPNNLNISAVSEEQNSANEDLAVESNVDMLEIGFNAKYILDIMSVIEDDTASFWFTDSYSPALIKKPEDDSCCYIVMPMRI